MPEGKVKWFNTRKGYGFISSDDGTDIFVHYSNIAAEGYKTLAEGDEVTFDVVEGEKGLRAENVIPKGAPKAEAAPETKAAPKAEAVPETKAAPKAEAVPETKAAPKAKAAPKRKAPKRKAAAETEEAPEGEEAVEIEEAPESESDAETE